MLGQLPPDPTTEAEALRADDRLSGAVHDIAADEDSGYGSGAGDTGDATGRLRAGGAGGPSRVEPAAGLKVAPSAGVGTGPGGVCGASGQAQKRAGGGGWGPYTGERPVDRVGDVPEKDRRRSVDRQAQGAGGDEPGIPWTAPAMKRAKQGHVQGGGGGGGDAYERQLYRELRCNVYDKQLGMLEAAAKEPRAPRPAGDGGWGAGDPDDWGLPDSPAGAQRAPRRGAGGGVGGGGASVKRRKPWANGGGGGGGGGSHPRERHPAVPQGGSSADQGLLPDWGGDGTGRGLHRTGSAEGDW